MNLVPLNRHIVVKRIEAEEKTAGGIIIPDTAKEKPLECEIVALPNGENTYDLKVGDHLLVGKYTGDEVTVNGEQLLIINEDDALCVVER